MTTIRELVSLRRAVPGTDLALSALGLAFGAQSLLYPLGRDQGLFFYIGREWLQGSIPYRDAFDQKPPLIHAIYALGIAVFGEHPWAIRACELGWVVALGWVVGASCAGDGAPAPGLRGLGAFALSVLYFGYFGFWDTAQTEIWAGGFVVLALWAALRIRGDVWRPVCCGLFGGLALLAKPTALLPLLPVFAVVGVRSFRRGAVVEVATLLGAALVPPLLAVAYFFALGALPSAIEAVVYANRHNLEHEARFGSTAGVIAHALGVASTAHPLSTLILFVPVLACTVAARRRDTALLGRHALCLALIVAAFASVCVQRKFYWYHWGIVVPVGAVAAVQGLKDLVSIRAAPVLGAVVLAGTYAVTWPARVWAHLAVRSAEYAAGKLPRSDFLREFDLPGFYDYARDERIGIWIGAHSGPEDLVAVRGFEPAIYAVARRRAPTRFFWTEWLNDSRRAYRRSEWLAEDRTALIARPPRYVVAFDSTSGGPNAPGYFQPLGYEERFRDGSMSVLERVPVK